MVKPTTIIFLLTAVYSFSLQAQQDPTAPLGWKTPETVVEQKTKKKKVYRLPTLSGIVCKPTTPCIAILNGRMVEEKATINGYKVAKVDSEYVTLKRDSRAWKLELFKLNIKH